MVPELNRYHNLRRKGAVPPLGSLGALYCELDPVIRARLVRRIRHDDRALSDTIARVLTEALNGPSRR